MILIDISSPQNAPKRCKKTQSALEWHLVTASGSQGARKGVTENALITGTLFAYNHEYPFFIRRSAHKHWNF